MEVEFRNSIESAILICSELAEKRWRGPFQWLDHWFCWRRNLKIENAVAIFSACSGHTEIGLPNNRLMTSERLHSIRQCEPIDRSWSGGGPVRREVVTAMQMASQVSQTNDWTKAFFEREREREREKEKRQATFLRWWRRWSPIVRGESCGQQLRSDSMGGHQRNTNQPIEPFESNFFVLFGLLLFRILSFLRPFCRFRRCSMGN